MTSVTPKVSSLQGSVPDDYESIEYLIEADPGYDIGDWGGDYAVIADDEPIVTIIASDATAAETGNNPGEFTVSRSGPTTAALTVTYTFSRCDPAGVQFCFADRSVRTALLE